MSYNNAYGINEDGKLAVRVIGSGGGGQTIRNQDKTITENGTYTADSGYTGLGTVTVNVQGTSVEQPYLELSIDENGVLANSTTATKVIDISGATNIYEYRLFNAYYKNKNISGDVDFSSILELTYVGACLFAFEESTINGEFKMGNCTRITGNSACRGMFQNSKIKKADLSSLVAITGPQACDNMFSGSDLEEVDIHNLESITANGTYAARSMFLGTKIRSIDLGKLNSLGFYNYAFIWALAECENLEEVMFKSLTRVPPFGMQNCFNADTNLKRVYFYALTAATASSFTDMLANCSNVTVRFPIAITTTIPSITTWADVTNGFGGTNTTVLFDIVTTLTGADGNTYTRQEKDSTATATAWVYNDTLYYTAGTTEPAVDGTIYSDAECTQTVTTITAIA